MAPKPHRRLTDPKWLFRYAVNNPKRALVYGGVAVVVILVVTVSFAVEAVPVWIGGLVAGLALIAGSLEPVNRARLLWAASERSTGAVDSGAVSVSGQAVAVNDRRLTSELQAVDCLAYEYTKTTTTNRSEGGSSSSTSTSQTILPFYVDDGSGPVLVDATTGTLSLHADETDTSGSKKREEGVIRDGDEVTVYGEAQRPDSGRDLLAEADRVVTTGPEYGDVVVTDRSGTRVLAGQVAYALSWLGIGGLLVVAAIGVALGLVSL